MSDNSTFPPYVDYQGQRLLLLETKEQPEIAGTPTRLGYGYAGQGNRPDKIILYRWDFGRGVDWELTWANSAEKSYQDFIAEVLSWDETPKELKVSLAKEYPELLPTEKLRHKRPKRPRSEKERQPKTLQATPPEAKGERPRMNLSDFIRPFQSAMTKGDKKK